MTCESAEELVALRRCGRVVALTLRAMVKATMIDTRTRDLDDFASWIFAQHGARSSPRLYYGFPGTTCISVNDQAVHGIPGERVVKAGDVVKLDVTAELDGYVTDTAVTVAVPPVTTAVRQLVSGTRSALASGIAAARAGRPMDAIGAAVAAAASSRALRIIPELGGHGVGRAIHDEPFVANYPRG